MPTTYDSKANSLGASMIHNQTVVGACWEDESDHHRTATLLNGPTWHASGGPGWGVPGYFSFDGVDDVITVGAIDGLNYAGDRTFVWWERQNGAVQSVSWTVRMGKGDAYAARNYYAHAGRHSFIVKPDTHTYTDAVAPANTWVMHMARFTGTAYEIWRIENGVAVRRANRTKAATLTTEPTKRFAYGARDTGTGWDRFYRGDLAGCSVYPRAISTTEFEQLYQASIESQPVLNYDIQTPLVGNLVVRTGAPTLARYYVSAGNPWSLPPGYDPPPWNDTAKYGKLYRHTKPMAESTRQHLGSSVWQDWHRWIMQPDHVVNGTTVKISMRPGLMSEGHELRFRVERRNSTGSTVLATSAVSPVYTRNEWVEGAAPVVATMNFSPGSWNVGDLLVLVAQLKGTPTGGSFPGFVWWYQDDLDSYVEVGRSPNSSLDYYRVTGNVLKSASGELRVATAGSSEIVCISGALLNTAYKIDHAFQIDDALPGSATLKYYEGGVLVDSWSVNYITPSITSVNIPLSTLSLDVNATAQLEVDVVSVGDADQGVTWSSSNSSRATVDSTGVVTAVSAGAVTITATSVFDSSKSDTLALTVLASSDDAYLSHSYYSHSTNTPVAFKGAMGYGAKATGGRGNGTAGDTRLIFVTSLADNTTSLTTINATDGIYSGTLRGALQYNGKRVIVPKLSGYVELTSGIEVTNPNATLLGQLAPGGGMGIKPASLPVGYKLLWIKANNIILRYMTLRAGQTDSNSSDCISVGPAQDVILDHLSAAFATDGNIDVVANAFNETLRVTMQNCLLSFPLENAGRPTEADIHAYQTLIQKAGQVSVLYNLFSNQRSRVTEQGGGPLQQHIGNTIYNWNWSATVATHSGTQTSHMATVDFQRNTYKRGPAWDGKASLLFLVNGNAEEYGLWTLRPKTYLEGNDAPEIADPTVLAQQTAMARIKTDPNYAKVMSEWVATTSHNTPTVRMQTAKQAYALVTSSAGNFIPGIRPRDSLDTRAVRMTLGQISGLSKMYTSVDHAGGYPTLASGTYPTTPDDGIPETWRNWRNEQRKWYVKDTSGTGRMVIENYADDVALGLFNPYA
jgi:hypothetical protein